MGAKGFEPFQPEGTGFTDQLGSPTPTRSRFQNLLLHFSFCILHSRITHGEIRTPNLQFLRLLPLPIELRGCLNLFVYFSYFRHTRTRIRTSNPTQRVPRILSEIPLPIELCAPDCSISIQLVRGRTRTFNLSVLSRLPLPIELHALLQG